MPKLKPLNIIDDRPSLTYLYKWKMTNRFASVYKRASRRGFKNRYAASEFLVRISKKLPRGYSVIFVEYPEGEAPPYLTIDAS